MCTVTIIPTKNSYYLTSNRDELVTTGKAIIPQRFEAQGGGDKETDLMVHRADEIATASVTSLEVSAQHSSLQYLDMINYTSHKGFLPLTTATQMEAVAHAS